MKYSPSSILFVITQNVRIILPSILSSEYLHVYILHDTRTEKNPIVSMCVLGNYQCVAESVGPEYIASCILPTIQPMLVDRYCTHLCSCN